jgi:hypothetical protein
MRKSDLRILVESHGVSYNVYRGRINRGWTHEKALSKERHTRRKITADDMKNIYALLDARDYHLKKAAELSNKAIAEKMELSLSYIDKLSSGQNFVKYFPRCKAASI